MARIQLERLPENDSELYELVKVLWGVVIPREKVCPDHVAPFDVFADAYFRRGSSISLWHGSRGLSGKSFMLSILGLTIAFLRGSDVNILGGSLAQSTNVHEHMRNAMDSENSPRYMIETEAYTQIKLTNRARIRPLTASQKTVRGPHPATLLCLATGSLVDTPAGFVEIQDLCEGQVVYGSSDMAVETQCIVTRKTCSGYQNTLLVETDHAQISCTYDHKFWTQRGWVEAQDLTEEDMLSVRESSLRPVQKYDRSMWGVLQEEQDDETEELLAVRRGYTREGRQEIRYVQGVLADREEQEQSQVSLRGVRSRTSDVQRISLQGLLQQGESSKSKSLSGLRGTTKISRNKTLSSLPLEVDEQRCGCGEICRSESNWESRNSHFQGRRTSSGTSGLAKDQVQQVSSSWQMGSGLCSQGLEDSNRSTRSLLARSSREHAERQEEESVTRGQGVHSSILEDRPDAFLVQGRVKSVSKGLTLETWDITTTTGNFFADGVLVHNCDEIDEMDEDILNAALGQPMPQTNYLGEIIKPYTILCSTWQNSDSTFEHKYREFQEKGLPIKTWCYRESANPIDGWLTQETIDQKKLEIPAEMWRVEYELGEPSIGNRAFDTDAVENMFSLPMEPLQKQEKQRFEEYTFEEPVGDGIYIAAADWAKEQDFTVISVIRLDLQPHTLVYYMRVNRRPYPAMIKWFNDAIERYNAEAIHDATGLGNVVNDYIDVRARKFIMTGEKRSNMLTEFVGAVERGYFKFPRVASAFSALKYCRTGDLYSGATKDYHLPDEVCSFALAWNAGKKFSGYGEPVTVKRDGAPGKYEKHFMIPGVGMENNGIISPSYIEGVVVNKSEGEDDMSFSLTV